MTPSSWCGTHPHQRLGPGEVLYRGAGRKVPLRVLQVIRLGRSGWVGEAIAGQRAVEGPAARLVRGNSPTHDRTACQTQLGKREPKIHNPMTQTSSLESAGLRSRMATIRGLMLPKASNSPLQQAGAGRQAEGKTSAQVHWPQAAATPMDCDLPAVRYGTHQRTHMLHSRLHQLVPARLTASCSTPAALHPGCRGPP